MNTKVGIGIEAQLDTSGVEQRLNALGQKVAQASGQKFNPVSKTSLEDLDKMVKRFEQLGRVHGDLAKRMRATGQGGKAMWDLNWEQLYPDANSRSRQTRKAMDYVVGDRFSAPTAAPPGHGGGGGNGKAPPAPPKAPTMWDHAKEQGGRIAGAGLRAAGPVGGVVAQGAGGMSAGFGAGLMGLMGGLAALAVGKIVGSITEKIGEAEQNNVAMDKLKRTLGDVNVSFNALKAVVHGAGDGLKITYAEAGQLATQFVKLGNVSSDKYKTISDELEVGVGLSKGFGVDNAQGVGMMGQMRGIGVTNNTQESRRFALLIGETIGRSGAFAKADEVMEAIGSYATMQTRASMGAANVDGYAGMYSAMVGSKMPGMDPQGAAAMLGRVNSSLSNGGAFGEASQFFTSGIGARMGLDPFQTQVLREGGAFATNDEAFGEGSAAKRFGMQGPKGSETFLQKSLDQLRGQYGSNKGMLAQATANHLGINMRQAMGLLSVEPNQMGKLQGLGDLSKVTGSGIGNMSKAMFGTDEDRQSIADSLRSRKDVDAGHKAEIDTVMAGGDSKAQGEVLARLTAQYEQERTTGSDIRDSKAALDNIKVSLADKMVPLMNEMRMGIMFMAGKDGKMSPKDIMESVMRAEGRDKNKSIDADFEKDMKKNGGDLLSLRKTKLEMMEGNKARIGRGEMTVEDHQRQMQPLLNREAELLAEDGKIRERHNKALADAATLLEDNVKKMRGADNQPEQQSLGVTPGGGVVGGGRGRVNPGGAGAATGSGSAPAIAAASSKGPVDTSTLDGKLLAADRANGLPDGTMKSIMRQETGGKQDYIDDPEKYHYGLDANGRRTAPHTGKISTAFGPFGILESTASKPGYGVSPLKSKGLDDQIDFAGKYLGGRVKSAGSLEAGLAGYGEGDKYSRSVMGRIAREQRDMAQREKLPEMTTKREELPAGAGGGRGSVNPAYNVTADDMTVRVVNEHGKPMGPPQTVATRVQSNFPMNK